MAYTETLGGNTLGMGGNVTNRPDFDGGDFRSLYTETNWYNPAAFTTPTRGPSAARARVPFADPELAEGLAAPTRFTRQRRENQIAKSEDAYFDDRYGRNQKIEAVVIGIGEGSEKKIVLRPDSR